MKWQPKKRVICSKCGWAGYRVKVYKPCPKCKHYWPEIEYKHIRKRATK